MIAQRIHHKQQIWANKIILYNSDEGGMGGGSLEQSTAFYAHSMKKLKGLVGQGDKWCVHNTLSVLKCKVPLLHRL